ncbi:MAG: glycoside hydrolase family 3 C-terminal domain-containing protein [bacterium]
MRKIIISKNASGKFNAGAIVLLAACLAISALLLCVKAQAADSENAPIYKDQNAPIEKRVDALIGLLTLEEKISMIHGDVGAGTSMDTKAIPRLGIPRFQMSDGPNGVRWGASTAFPPGITMASTWNEDLLYRYGVALGRETLAKGRNMILGPCVNIHRVPFGGRNFESYSEDPFLAARIAVGYIKGVQSQNVVATVKHFAMNNQEIDRGTVSVETDERTMQEIYLPQFKAAIQEAGSYSVMCSYNKINGIYACENHHLLTDILKNDWGFKGFVVSDWGAVHSTIPTAMSGMDIEMPNGAFTGKDLLKAVQDGKVPVSVIDDKVRRILRVMITTGLYDHKINVDVTWFDSAESRLVALDLAREGIVLLKNKGGILPLDKKKIKKIAVIGPNAKFSVVGGGGSSEITPLHTDTPLEGILKQAPIGTEVNFALGCDLLMPVEYEIVPTIYLTPAGDMAGDSGLFAEYFNSVTPAGKPVASIVEKQIDFNWGGSSPIEGINKDSFSARWTGKLVPPTSGEYKFVVVSNSVAQLFINGKLKVNYWANDSGKGKIATVNLKAGEEYKIRFEYQNMGRGASAQLGWQRPGVSPMNDAAKLAKESDVAIVFAGIDKRLEGEGHDRDSLEIPGLQNELIKKIVAANPNTIVVLQNGTPLIMKEWLDKVPALVEAWYPGQEGGRAIAEILFGDVNPSGRLSITMPNSWEESPAFGNYPGKNLKVNYSDGIFIGYRYYDAKGIEPVFPFGFGLSYTDFKYSDLKISPEKMGADGKKITVSLNVKNTGARAGKEVVQLYVSDIKSSAPRPIRELKGIRKIYIEPGESKNVTFDLDQSALSFFDPKKNKWVAEPGAFEIEAGSSSRDIKVKGAFTLQ